ncbi:hypothetical protein MA16_Dca016828 [Dendrobium catenatum]|uniref:Uncharacterized protein n=1 Tax=Dendrobium catenatum TaxID=906689 RepID=A0A2I0VYI0_9ASPA|nr:hypothetical protein MA16_Dca016828 [Dendrobium catenatum]
MAIIGDWIEWQSYGYKDTEVEGGGLEAGDWYQQLTDFMTTGILEHDVEAVINVLQPGPLGIIEHKFSAEEVRKAKAIAEQAIKNWKRNAYLENKNHFNKHAANQSPGIN